MFKKYFSLVMPIGLIVLGVGMFATSFSMKSLVEVPIGPGAVPRILAVFLIFLSIINIITELKTIRAQAPEPQVVAKPEEESVVKQHFFNRHAFPCTLLLVFSYGYLLSSVGFVYTSIPYLFLQICVFTNGLHVKSVVKYLLISVITVVGIYMIFTKLFLVQLPTFSL